MSEVRRKIPSVIAPLPAPAERLPLVSPEKSGEEAVAQSPNSGGLNALVGQPRFDKAFQLFRDLKLDMGEVADGLDIAVNADWAFQIFEKPFSGNANDYLRILRDRPQVS